MKVKNILAIIIIVLILTTTLGYVGVQQINRFFSDNELKFNQVLKVDIKSPMEIKKREPQIKQVVLDYPDEINTDLEKYICVKFGVYECKTALAIAQAESGLREDAIGINNNRTVDLGVFQINSVHFKKEGCSPKELLDQFKNVDCAFNIFKASGFSPWVTFKNGNYLIKLAENR